MGVVEEVGFGCVDFVMFELESDDESVEVAEGGGVVEFGGFGVAQEVEGSGDFSFTPVALKFENF